MTHTQKPPFRTRMLFGAFLLVSAFGLSTAAATPEPGAYLVKSGSSVQTSSKSSTSRVRRVVKRKAVPAKSALVRPPSRRKDSGALLRGAATESSSSRTAVKAGCGDKFVTGSETCDDGNALAGDGCSSSCLVETGYSCTAQPSECWSRCGDGVVASDEKCDDGDLDAGDGCNAACKIEITYKCSGSPSVCTVPPYCGNGTKEEGEACDDGNSSLGDGCTPECKTE